MPRRSRAGPTAPDTAVGDVAVEDCSPQDIHAAVAANHVVGRLNWRIVATLVAAASLAGGLAGGIVSIALEDLRNDTPTASNSESTNASAVIERARKSVVRLDVAAETYEGSVAFSVEHTGTGTVLSEHGVIATNAHLVLGAKRIVVTFQDGTQLPAVLLGLDPVEDLAVLRVERNDLAPIARGSSSTLGVGDTVIALGNALGLEGAPSATRGIVSALERRVSTGGAGGLEHLIQTDAAINDGNSGGPLVDVLGRLVGINTGRSTIAENVGFAIAIDHALPILKQLADDPLDE